MTEKKIQPQRKALRTRERARNKKPAFLRQESWRDSKFSESWRRPRGLDNKVRRKVLGWPASPSTGYKGPKVARYLHPSGYREVIVYNAGAVAAVDPNTQAIRIAHTVGTRKRALIIAEAEKLNVKVLNAVLVEEEAEAEGEEEAEAEQEAEKKTEKAKEKKEKRPKAKEDKSKAKKSKEKKK
ncbi:MAG: 50S ribosomal protein L32e [Candidatus Bathyarchaeia archaeon]|jgi:large subunit ribosomal protein L32e